MSNNKDIWVFIEQVEGKVANVSFDLLGEAVRLKNQMKEPGNVIAVLLGSEIKELGKTAIEYGAEKAYIADDPRLKLYQPEYYAGTLEYLINQYNPYIFLVGATSIGSQLAPAVAAKVKTGVAAHSIELKIDEEDQLVAVVPAFGGKVLGDIYCPKHYPKMASIKPGILGKAEKINSNGEIINVDLGFLNDIKATLKPLSLVKEETKGVPLEEAEIVICGGWGIGDKGYWEYLEVIADKLGAAVACSRPAIDEGWASGEHMMIGTSGKVVRPKIYLGFGISGATHHVCGMKDSDLIININKDDEADIFSVSDYGIKGDIREILPLLAKAIN